MRNEFDERVSDEGGRPAERRTTTFILTFSSCSLDEVIE